MNSPNSIKLAIVSLLIILSMGSLLFLGALYPDVPRSLLPLSISGNAFVDAKLAYQLITLVIALVLLAIIFWLFPKNARRFYRLGDSKAPAGKVSWLGIKEGDTWRSVGTSFAVIVSLATGAFIYFNVAQGNGIAAEHLGLLLFVPLLAALNAFTEESIARLAVVTSLDGVIGRPTIYLISALLFGIPHYFGVPGCWLGALMAGFLGWLLARSVAETEGMGWAWFIHFLQDVIIFAGLFLVAL